MSKENILKMVEEEVGDLMEDTKDDTNTRTKVYKAVKIAKNRNKSSDSDSNDLQFESKNEDWDSIQESENWGYFVHNNLSPYNHDRSRINDMSIILDDYDKGLCSSSSRGSIKINKSAAVESPFKSAAEKLYDFLISGADFSDPW